MDSGRDSAVVALWSDKLTHHPPPTDEQLFLAADNTSQRYRFSFLAQHNLKLCCPSNGVGEIRFLASIPHYPQPIKSVSERPLSSALQVFSGLG